MTRKLVVETKQRREQNELTKKKTTKELGIRETSQGGRTINDEQDRIGRVARATTAQKRQSGQFSAAARQLGDLSFAFAVHTAQHSGQVTIAAGHFYWPL